MRCLAAAVLIFRIRIANSATAISDHVMSHHECCKMTNNPNHGGRFVRSTKLYMEIPYCWKIRARADYAFNAEPFKLDLFMYSLPMRSASICSFSP